MNRRGFTLIEVMVCIVIIIILMGFLLPVLNSSIKTTKNAAQNSEFYLIDKAMADFQSKYGNYAPSRIFLVENGDYTSWTTAIPRNLAQLPKVGSIAYIEQTYSEFALQSKRELLKLFPRAISPANLAKDWNKDGDFDDVYVLDGHEALPFFLSGFSSSPSYPFSDKTTQPAMNFTKERLVDLDGDGFPSWIDSFNTNVPVAYFRAPYNPLDNNVVEVVDGVQSISHFAGKVYLSPNPYINVNPATFSNKTESFHNAQTYQLISAGADGKFGANAAVSFVGGETEFLGTDAKDEALDNIVNFHNGKLSK